MSDQLKDSDFNRMARRRLTPDELKAVRKLWYRPHTDAIELINDIIRIEKLCIMGVRKVYEVTIRSKAGCFAAKQPDNMVSVFDTLHDAVDWISNTIRLLARESGGLHYDVAVVLEIDASEKGW